MTVKQHGAVFCFLTATVRLNSVGLTFTAYQRLQDYLVSAIQRGSRLCYEDVKSAVDMIIQYPFIGGHKGSITMLDTLSGLMGETSYKEIKNLLKDLIEDTHKNREMESEIQLNMQSRKSKPNDDLITSDGVHDVWSIDFTEVKVFGVKMYGCVVYDLFSQGYMSFEIFQNNDADAACQAFKQALQRTGCSPKVLVSDNGSHFVNEKFRQAVGEIQHYFIPPGKPWLNGALESGNKDLKKMFYTQMFYNLEADKSVSISGVSIDKLLLFAKEAASDAIEKINNHVVRPKHAVPPQVVIDNNIQQHLELQQEFRQERENAKDKMLQSIKEGGEKLKTLKQKVKSIWSMIARNMTDDKLYALRELIHGRYQAVKN